MRAHPHKPAPRSSQPASHAYPDRQYVSASSHNHGQATPNRQNPPAETASCESILTQSPIGDVATAIRSPEPSSCERILTRTRSSRIGPTDPDRQTVTVRVNPHTMTAARLRISQPHQPTRHRANKSSHNDTPTPPSQPILPVRPSPCEQNLTQWPPLTSKSANPASPPAIVRTNPHTTTAKPRQTGRSRPPNRQRVSESSHSGPWQRLAQSFGPTRPSLCEWVLAQSGLSRCVCRGIRGVQVDGVTDDWGARSVGLCMSGHAGRY